MWFIRLNKPTRFRVQLRSAPGQLSLEPFVALIRVAVPFRHIVNSVISQLKVAVNSKHSYTGLWARKHSLKAY